MRIRCGPLAVLAAGVLLCGNSEGGQRRSEGLRYRTFRKAIYSIASRRYVPFKHDHHYERSSFLALRHVGREPTSGAANYNVTIFHFEFDTRKVPRFTIDGDELAIGPQGTAIMFGMHYAENQRRATFLTDHLFSSQDFPPFVPVLPESSQKLRVGSRWEMKVPPFPHALSDTRNPSKKHVVLRQRWLSIENVNGFECAKISYEIKDQGTVKDARFVDMATEVSISISGIVYFALQEGLVVMDTNRVETSLSAKGRKEQQKTRKERNLILMQHTPLGEEAEEQAPREPWRYRFRPVPQRLQRERPRDGVPLSAKKAPRGRTPEEIIAWLREEIRKREERLQEEKKRRDGAPPTPDEVSRKRTLEQLKAMLRERERRQKEKKGQE